MKKLIIENTYRSLLIYMLYDPRWKERDYILIRGRISDEFIDRIKSKVNEVQVRDDFPVISIKALLSTIYSRLAFLRKISKYDEVYGNVYELKLRKAKQKLVLIDDGLMTKKVLSGGYKFNISHLAFRNNLMFRLLFNVNYKTDNSLFYFLIPESYKMDSNQNSCEFFNINKAINNLSNQDYQEICEVFGFIPSKLKGKSVLMLQPFFEDCLVSSIDYEINIYKHILDTEGVTEEDIYIKPHPRSNINYNKYFKKAEFIPKDFPYELLVRESNDNKFKKVMSVHSSGLDAFIPIAEEVVSFGTSEFSELEFFPMNRN